MKYYKSNSFIKKLTSTGFVTITTCILIAIGAIGWFALSRNNTIKDESSSSDNTSSYIQPEVSYNETVSEETPTDTTDVNETVSDIPYSESETTTEAIEDIINFILPIEGNIIKGYSDTALQYSLTYNDMRLHTGIDIACELDSEIKAVGSGTVKSVVDDANYGKIITIDHTGELTVKYCGFKEVKVNEGDNVNSGDIIGILGEIPCECADKPHIHIEALLQNTATAPLAALGLE